MMDPGRKRVVFRDVTLERLHVQVTIGDPCHSDSTKWTPELKNKARGVGRESVDRWVMDLIKAQHK